MTIKLPAPLPECRNCGRPTRRTVHDRTGGHCTACFTWANASRAVGPDRAQESLESFRDWQRTVFRIRRAEVAKAAERAARRRARRR